MGRASRWLRGLLGGKKVDAGEPPGELRDRRRWGFGKSFREKERPLALPQQRRRGESLRPPSPGRCREQKVSASCREASMGLAAVENSEEQSKRAIVVATATAAAAEAAVAAAQAAAVVVRLTSSGRAVVGLAGGKRESWAAVKIQSAFRGYLARRALKALRGLVKLQALVRGNIVRKQAAETLRCMQALVRVQARARTCRALCSAESRSANGPRVLADLEQGVGPIQRNPSKNSGIHTADCIAGWNWLDRWMEERHWEARRGEKVGASSASMDDAKILEVDPGKPQPVHSHKRNSHHHYSCSTLASDHNSRSFTTIQDSPSKDSSAAALQSVPSPSSVDVESSLSLFSAYADYPGYMASTASSKARLRSHSAPRQRPADYDRSGSAKRSSGAFYQASLQAKFANRGYPGSGRLDRLGMPLRV